jgi:hypothetical protein
MNTLKKAKAQDKELRNYVANRLQLIREVKNGTLPFETKKCLTVSYEGQIMGANDITKSTEHTRHQINHILITYLGY